MSNAKFTNGKWGVVVHETAGVVCHVSVRGDFGGFEVTKCDNAKANAHLISAAPEMYDMLNSIENDANQIPPFLWDKIQAVLAKARGEHV